MSKRMTKKRVIKSIERQNEGEISGPSTTCKGKPLNFCMVDIMLTV